MVGQAPERQPVVTWTARAVGEDVDLVVREEVGMANARNLGHSTLHCLVHLAVVADRNVAVEIGEPVAHQRGCQVRRIKLEVRDGCSGRQRPSRRGRVGLHARSRRKRSSPFK